MSSNETLLYVARERFLDIMASHQQDPAAAADTAIKQAEMFMSKLNLAEARNHPFAKTVALKGCPKCFGSGGKRNQPCKYCGGSGKVPA